MNKSEIVNYLIDNGIEEIEEIDYEEDMCVLKFYYDFKKEEILEARTYSSDDDETNKESYYRLYLNDIARDNVSDILEDLKEEFSIEVQHICYDEEVDKGFIEFIGAFYEIGKDVDIDDVLSSVSTV